MSPACRALLVCSIPLVLFPWKARALDIGPPSPLHLFEYSVVSERTGVPLVMRVPASQWALPEGKPLEETETIERVSGEERGPRIPEPMVFDLVRPLGAKHREGEINVLNVIPLRRKSMARARYNRAVLPNGSPQSDGPNGILGFYGSRSLACLVMLLCVCVVA